LRSLILGLALVVAGISTAWADPPPFRAGVTRIAVQDTTPFDALIAYPTEAAEVSVEEGPIRLLASRDARVAAGARFPVVLFSHGGNGPGTPLVHRDLLLHLARGGFIVIGPFHPGTAQPFVDRPRQIHKALDSVLADPRFSKHADPDRIGMAGFSFGGAVTLLVAGARIDLAHLSAYCRDHADDTRACEGIATDGSWAKVPPSRKSDDALPLKALVLLEPYGAPFDQKSLGSLDLPILIYSASQSDLRAEGNALAVAKALPRPPQQAAVPGSHFVFVDPCSPILAARAPQVCGDPPGTDRAAIHQRVRREIADFLQANM
jgi:predicted dienelactone hydrolase